MTASVNEVCNACALEEVCVCICTYVYIVFCACLHVWIMHVRQVKSKTTDCQNLPYHLSVKKDKEQLIER